MIYKTQKLPIKNQTIKAKLVRGFWGIKALESGEVTSQQIETIRKLLSPFLRKKMKVFWRVKPCFAKTAKAFGSRMGSGKGAISTLYSKVHRGQILLEFSSLIIKPPVSVLKKIHSKLGIKTTYIFKGL